MQKKNLKTIILILFRDSLRFYQYFLSQQVKRCALITYEHGIYELLNDLSLTKLGNIRKVLRLHKKIA